MYRREVDSERLRGGYVLAWRLSVHGKAVPDK